MTNGEDINSVTQIAVALLNYAGQIGITESERYTAWPIVILHQNYPNPFSNSTNIRFTLQEASDVKLTVFNVIGQEVSALFDGELAAGDHSIFWQPDGLPNGVYYYQLVSRGRVHTKRCIIID